MTAKLFWTRADKQGDMPMGEYATAAEAEAAIPAMTTELLEQCGADQSARDEIADGSWDIVEVESDD